MGTMSILVSMPSGNTSSLNTKTRSPVAWKRDTSKLIESLRFHSASTPPPKIGPLDEPSTASNVLAAANQWMPASP